MNCKVGKSQISGIITCPSNKSYTHRAIFIAALAGKPSTVSNFLLSEDTKATICACEALGASLEISGRRLSIKEPIGAGKIADIVNAVNSGTTIRIAAAIASLLDKKITLTGDESLKKRPMKPLLDSLTDLGAKCKSQNGTPPIEVKGKIIGGKTSIAGNVSSQFISALLIAAPLMKSGLTININGNLVSKPYLDLTIASLKKFGIFVKEIEKYKKYEVLPQRYEPAEFTVPSDFSSLALLLSAAILVGKDLVVKINSEDLPQADKKFLEILEKLGIDVKIKNNTVSLGSINSINGGKFDLYENPDLLPPLSILSLKSKKSIEIHNVKHARYKETDRISILTKQLSKTGLNIVEKEGGLILNPVAKLKGAKLESSGDHRLFMAFCIVGMHIGDCVITDAESVGVSYPEFISDIKKAGGKLTIE
ncbi:MAG: 3-phosphoshikimate 1-carboxyvinyltransferase [Nitrosopumilaceae archaeon]|nr:3-phosphoshikimate 1-carboxyvinyltransferase [Nitrosopumilaceae archaeon]NIU00117.1 3-phosphoshikimate 1-carboxyvinyltransferase [Nitrosopumilaceae archaeon]NIU86507.1 3-phosphoshikimate 1-carboxyvinyltransferase [Nitrosopumilaceae archaeon]NIV65742.1 3-phosphoshikimate 1-carboxyvinyltransferase [Nitrosopumilaceae archaeon]NIX60719.1 3-phosphoshikimate 1-carboxyvinyltransferase [Nitrosopumilaceae archaeon]